MKIFEIETNNQVMIILQGFDTKFDEEEALFIKAYTLFSKTKHCSKLSELKIEIEEYLLTLNAFITYDWPDKTDPDIANLINKAITSKNNLEILLNK
jgi:hypothetical protein